MVRLAAIADQGAQLISVNRYQPGWAGPSVAIETTLGVLDPLDVSVRLGTTGLGGQIKCRLIGGPRKRVTLSLAPWVFGGGSFFFYGGQVGAPLLISVDLNEATELTASIAVEYGHQRISDIEAGTDVYEDRLVPGCSVGAITKIGRVDLGLHLTASGPSVIGTPPGNSWHRPYASAILTGSIGFRFDPGAE